MRTQQSGETSNKRILKYPLNYASVYEDKSDWQSWLGRKLYQDFLPCLEMCCLYFLYSHFVIYSTSPCTHASLSPQTSLTKHNFKYKIIKNFKRAIAEFFNEYGTHMIILIHAEKAFDKVQHLFMIKTLNKMGIKGLYLNIIKAIYDKPQLTSYSMGKRWKHFF